MRSAIWTSDEDGGAGTLMSTAAPWSAKWIGRLTPSCRLLPPPLPEEHPVATRIPMIPINGAGPYRVIAMVYRLVPSPMEDVAHSEVPVITLRLSPLVVVEDNVGGPGHLPAVAFWIRDVAGVAAPVRLCGMCDRRASRTDSKVIQPMNFGFGLDVDREGDAIPLTGREAPAIRRRLGVQKHHRPEGDLGSPISKAPQSAVEPGVSDQPEAR